MTKHQLTRRRFLQHSLSSVLAAGLAPAFIPASALGREPGRPSPANRVTVASIGVGPQGMGVMGQFLQQDQAQVVAVCDVFRDHLHAAARQVNAHYKDSGCATFADFREVLRRPDIDAVVIATPDHWHVPMAAAAVKAGKDIYVEKPLGLTLAEDQILRTLVQKKRRVFQFGTQQRSFLQFRQACELVRNRRLGRLQRIHVWAPGSAPGGSTQVVPVPAGFDYDSWLGPAPATPYTEHKCFGAGQLKNWWFQSDYALGFLSGWGIHPLDIAYWGHPDMMKGPITIEGHGTFPTEGACNTAVAWKLQYNFTDGVVMEYRGTANEYKEANALNDFTDWQKKYGALQLHGTVFEGTDGWVLVDRTTIRSFPESLIEDKISPNELHLPRSSNHAQNFLAAVQSRGTTVCPIEDSVRSDTLAHLADIATRLGRKLWFDPRKERFFEDAAANRRLGLRRARAPWGL